LESKSTFFILIVIVAVLALSLAALAGYLLIVQGSPGDSGDGRQDGSEEDTVVVPKEEDLL